MSLAAVGERYARAILELAEEAGRLAPLTQQVAAIAGVYAGSEDLRGVLDNPLVPEEQREAVLSQVAMRLGLDQLVVSLLRLLARRHRIMVLPEVARALQRMADEKVGILRATVRSAVPLSDADVQKLAQELERKTKQRVVINKEHDTSLIAGIVTRIGDKTIDGSLLGRLDALERQLLES